jgi:hypothetical protein
MELTARPVKQTIRTMATVTTAREVGWSAPAWLHLPVKRHQAVQTVKLVNCQAAEDRREWLEVAEDLQETPEALVDHQRATMDRQGMGRTQHREMEDHHPVMPADHPILLLQARVPPSWLTLRQLQSISLGMGVTKRFRYFRRELIWN